MCCNRTEKIDPHLGGHRVLVVGDRERADARVGRNLDEPQVHLSEPDADKRTETEKRPRNRNRSWPRGRRRGGVPTRARTSASGGRSWRWFSGERDSLPRSPRRRDRALAVAARRRTRRRRIAPWWFRGDLPHAPRRHRRVARSSRGRRRRTAYDDDGCVVTSEGGEGGPRRARRST